ncbi:MAG: thioesterase family protein [Planctomycetota bacterium]
MVFHDHAFRVRYAETDQMGVVYYAHHLVWFEAGRTEFFRALGLPYTELEAKGIFLPVGEAGCRYLAPARYDDELVVRTWVSEMGKAALRLSYIIRRKSDGTRIAGGFTRHLFVNRDFRPIRAPAEVVARVEVREAEPVEGVA